MAELHSLGQEETRQKHNLCSKAEYTYEILCGGVDILLHLPPDHLGKEWYNSEQSQPHIIMNMQTEGKPTQIRDRDKRLSFNNCWNLIPLLVKG